jgi:hypothetical protein
LGSDLAVAAWNKPLLACDITSTHNSPLHQGEFDLYERVQQALARSV